MEELSTRKADALRQAMGQISSRRQRERVRRLPAQFLAGPSPRKGEAESDARIHLMKHLNCRQIVSVSGNDDSLIEAPFTSLA
jgi:hypothetical protein